MYIISSSPPITYIVDKHNHKFIFSSVWSLETYVSVKCHPRKPYLSERLVKVTLTEIIVMQNMSVSLQYICCIAFNIVVVWLVYCK